MMGTLREDAFIFMIISYWILLRMRNVSNKSCRKNQNTHFMFNFFPKVVPFIVCKDMVEPEMPQMTIWCMRVASWISKDTRAKIHFYAVQPHQHPTTHVLAHTQTRIHTHSHTEVCNIYLFSTATVVTQTRLIVTLYARCLSCHC